VETSCRASPPPPPFSLHTTVQILEYIPFWSYFYIGARPFCVFLLYHLLCTTPTPWICNRSTETSKHRSNRCDRWAVSDNEQNAPHHPPPKKISGEVITKCDAFRHSASYLCLQHAYRFPATLLDTNLHPSSGLVLFAFTPYYRKEPALEADGDMRA